MLATPIFDNYNEITKIDQAKFRRFSDNWIS